MAHLPTLCNKLTQYIREINSAITFKKNLKQFISNHHILTKISTIKNTTENSSNMLMAVYKPIGYRLHVSHITHTPHPHTPTHTTHPPYTHHTHITHTRPHHTPTLHTPHTHMPHTPTKPHTGLAQ